MTDLSDYLDAVYGQTHGYAHLGIGMSPYRAASGKYGHRHWAATVFAWPDEREKALRAIEHAVAAGDSDVFACPYVLDGRKRAKGTAVDRTKVHADIDGDVDLDKVKALSGYAVASGTPGHGHVYVDLTEDIPPHWHEALCRALGAFLGHADPAKHNDNDVLRPPGTLNLKPTTHGIQAVPVEWLIRPSGACWQAHDLARVLGITLPAKDAPAVATTPEHADSGEVEPVDMATLPEAVSDALTQRTMKPDLARDRSVDTARVVAACARANLSLAQTRYVVRTDPELAARLDARPDDDVARLYVEDVDTEQFIQRLGDGTTTESPSESPNGQPGESEEEHTARVRSMFPALDWHDLWAADDEDEWWHKPLLPARRSVVIYSAPKVGKSLLMLELAVALSRGLFWLGYQIEQRRRVLYVDFENDPRGDIRTRLQDMGVEPDDLDHLDYLSFPSIAALDTERGGLELIEAVKAYRSDVVIIDTVSRTVQGEENSNDTWNAFYRHTGLRLKQLGVALIRLDHSGKDASRGARGGSAKAADPDVIWHLTRVTDTRFTLNCTQNRLPVQPQTMTIMRRTEPWLRHEAATLNLITNADARALDIVKMLDDGGIPNDAGRPTVRAFLTDHGIRTRNGMLSDVIRLRRQR